MDDEEGTQEVRAGTPTVFRPDFRQEGEQERGNKEDDNSADDNTHEEEGRVSL